VALHVPRRERCAGAPSCSCCTPDIPKTMKPLSMCMLGRVQRCLLLRLVHVALASRCMALPRRYTQDAHSRLCSSYLLMRSVYNPCRCMTSCTATSCNMLCMSSSSTNGCRCTHNIHDSSSGSTHFDFTNTRPNTRCHGHVPITTPYTTADRQQRTCPCMSSSSTRPWRCAPVTRAMAAATAAW
jgi:hypothetical protein